MMTVVRIGQFKHADTAGYDISYDFQLFKQLHCPIHTRLVHVGVRNDKFADGNLVVGVQITKDGQSLRRDTEACGA